MELVAPHLPGLDVRAARQLVAVAADQLMPGDPDLDEQVGAGVPAAGVDGHPRRGDRVPGVPARRRRPTTSAPRSAPAPSSCGPKGDGLTIGQRNADALSALIAEANLNRPHRGGGLPAALTLTVSLTEAERIALRDPQRFRDTFPGPPPRRRPDQRAAGRGRRHPVRAVLRRHHTHPPHHQRRHRSGTVRMAAGPGPREPARGDGRDGGGAAGGGSGGAAGHPRSAQGPPDPGPRMRDPRLRGAGRVHRAAPRHRVGHRRPDGPAEPGFAMFRAPSANRDRPMDLHETRTRPGQTRRRPRTPPLVDHPTTPITNLNPRPGGDTPGTPARP